MRSLIWMFLSCSLAAACTVNETPPPHDESPGSDAAPGRDIDRDATAPVQTDSLVLHLARQGDDAYAVQIGFRYRNETGRTVSIVNCDGELNIGLEKWIDGVWQPFFQPALRMCLSPPIEIGAGDVYTDSATIHGALPGSDMAPVFATPDLDGEYRLVWSNLVHDYDPNRSGFGDVVGPLHSNPFLLVAPH